MANKQRFNFDETKFRPKQREAAIALVEREFTPKGAARKTKQEIADELGITRKTLHNWDTKDPNFIAYKKYLSSDFMDSYLPFVYKRLIDTIERGSTRGIELYLKRIGDLDSHSELTINQGESDADKPFEERKAALLARLSEEDEK